MLESGTRGACAFPVGIEFDLMNSNATLSSDGHTRCVWLRTRLNIFCCHPTTVSSYSDRLVSSIACATSVLLVLGLSFCLSFLPRRFRRSSSIFSRCRLGSRALELRRSNLTLAEKRTSESNGVERHFLPYSEIVDRIIGPVDGTIVIVLDRYRHRGDLWTGILVEQILRLKHGSPMVNTGLSNRF